MKPAAFDYVAPATLDDTLSALAEAGEEGMLLAGGQTLVPLLNMRLARPDLVIDLNRVEGLADLGWTDSELSVGPMVRHLTLERDENVRTRLPLVAEAARHIAHLQVRTRGTVGGSLANAAPAAEWPAVAAALDARLFVRRAGGAPRELAPDDFFAGAMANSLDHDEMLVEIRLSAPPEGSGSAFVEFARRHGDFALAGAAAVVSLDGRGRASRIRLAMCGMARPGLRLPAVEDALLGTELADTDLDETEDLVRETVEAQGDFQLSSESRRRIAGAVARRALEAALRRTRRPASG